MIIDCHVHLPSPALDRAWEWAPCTPDVTAAAKYLRHCGVERVVANSMRGEVARTVEEMRAGNEEAMRAAREHDGLFIAACLVNPDLGDEALAEVRRCHDAGIVWLGEVCAYVGGFAYASEGFARVAALASDLNLVVQIHEEDNVEMEQLCREYPKVTWALSHLGDSPKECRERCELATRNPNLYLDICGHGFQRMGILELAVQCAGPERVLFGSDYTINDPAGVIVRVQKAGFDDRTKELILGGNVARMFAERGVRV